jgi:hypothetical protein
MEPNNQFANFRGAAAPFDWERLLHGGKSAAVSRSGVDADGWANTLNAVCGLLFTERVLKLLCKSAREERKPFHASKRTVPESRVSFSKKQSEYIPICDRRVLALRKHRIV